MFRLSLIPFISTICWKCRKMTKKRVWFHFEIVWQSVLYSNMYVCMYAAKSSRVLIKASHKYNLYSQNIHKFSYNSKSIRKEGKSDLQIFSWIIFWWMLVVIGSFSVYGMGQQGLECMSCRKIRRRVSLRKRCLSQTDGLQ